MEKMWSLGFRAAEYQSDGGLLSYVEQGIIANAKGVLDEDFNRILQ